MSKFQELRSEFGNHQDFTGQQVLDALLEAIDEQNDHHALLQRLSIEMWFNEFDYTTLQKWLY